MDLREKLYNNYIYTYISSFILSNVSNLEQVQFSKNHLGTVLLTIGLDMTYKDQYFNFPSTFGWYFGRVMI